MKAYIIDSITDLNKLLEKLKPSTLVDVKFYSQVVGSVLNADGITNYKMVDRFLVVVDESKKK